MYITSDISNDIRICLQEKDSSSDDESKGNETESPQPEKTARVSDSLKTKGVSPPERAKKNDPTTPLTINCDVFPSQKPDSAKVLQ